MNVGHLWTLGTWLSSSLSELVECLFRHQITTVPKSSRRIVWFSLCQPYYNVWRTASIKFVVTEWSPFTCQSCFPQWEQLDWIRKIVSAKIAFTTILSGGCCVKNIADDFMCVLVVTCSTLSHTVFCSSGTSWALGSITILIIFQALTYLLNF